MIKRLRTMIDAIIALSKLANKENIDKLAGLVGKIDQMEKQTKSISQLLLLQQTSPKILRELLRSCDVEPTVEVVADLEGGRMNYDLAQLANLRDMAAWNIFQMLWRYYSLPVTQVLRIFEYCLSTAVYMRADICAEIITFISYHLAADQKLLLTYCKTFETIPGCWQKKFAKIWPIYINALQLSGDTDKALYYLKKHKEIFSFASLYMTPSAALFAKRQGFSTTEIGVAATIAAEIEKNQKEGFLSKKIHNAGSIALVGNGPQDLRPGVGEQIDKYDLVFRFGGFKTNQSHKESDRINYGSKVDFWCTPKDIAKENSSLQTDTSILLTEFEGHYIKLDYLYNLKRYMQQEKRKILAVDHNFYSAFIAETQCWHPSSGLMIATLIKKMRPDLNSDSLFGFLIKPMMRMPIGEFTIQVKPTILLILLMP